MRIAVGCRLVVTCAALLFAATSPRRAVAQTPAEVITGRVVGPDSIGIEGARIELTSLATNVVRKVTTRTDGRFTILFRDGGGNYRLRVTAIGMLPATLPLARQPDEDRLDITVRMTRNTQTLATIEVKGRVAQRAQVSASAGAGSTQQAWSGMVLERLPLPMGDVASMTSMSPGVVIAPGTDSTSSSFSVAAQPAAQNNVKVDGASFLFGSLPQDGVRSTRVVTSAYDASRGQFTGGEVSMTTKSGSSLFEGNMSYTRRDPRLGSPGGAFGTLMQSPSLHTASGSAGGPLIGDRSFFFASGQLEQRSADLLSLGGMTPDGLRQLGVAPDSVAQLIGALGTSSLLRNGPTARTNRSGSGMLRVDWDATDSHALLMRLDWRGSDVHGSRTSPLALSTAGGTESSSGGGAMATITSAFRFGTNETRAYASRDRQTASPFAESPAGIVYLTSVDSQRTSVVPIQFGGNGSLPSESVRTLFETGNDALTTSIGKHQVRFGHAFTTESTERESTPNPLGTYMYSSLADFTAGRPSMYARSSGGGSRVGKATTGGVYVTDAWRATPSLNFTLGARVEGSRWSTATASNSAIPASLGVDPGTRPVDMRVSPRFGFRYLIGNIAGVPAGTISGGIGEFRGKVPSALLSAIAGANGLAGGASQLVCVGDAAPAIDWSGDLTGAQPSGCTSTPAASPTIIGLDPSLSAPRLWRASVSGQRRFATNWVLGGDASYAIGRDNLVAEDRNLGAARASLDDGRPMFADGTAIDPRTGTVSPQASRVDPAFGTVLQVGSGLRSRTAQLTGTLTGPGYRSGFTTLSYTLQHARDESNGYSLGNALPTTAGDPRLREWGRSDLERRHNVQVMTLTPLPRAFELTTITRLVSGASYTPMVAGDINGDGQPNDRAFIHGDDAAADIASGMRRLAGSADRRTRSCLEAQVSTMAARNSCATPWTATVDAQLNVRPAAMGLDRRLTLSLIASNITSGIDHIMHGAGSLRGWGQPSIPDRNLLFVTHYDGASGRYGYRVNERFGTSNRSRAMFAAPFQLAIQARVALGTDQQRAQMKAQLQDADGKRLGVAALKTRLLAGVPNPVKELLIVHDSIQLGLSADQRVRMERLKTAYEATMDTVGGTVAEIVTAAGPNPDPGVIGPKIAPIQKQLLATVERVVLDIKAALTPAQWAKLPEWVKLPLQVPAPKRGS